MNIENDISKNELKKFSLNNIAEAKNFFEINGFVIVKDVISEGDLASFKSDVKSVIIAYMEKAGVEVVNRESDYILNRGIIDLEAVDHDYVAAVYDTIFQMPSFFRIAGNPHTELYLKNILALSDESALYGFTNRCRIDPPMDERRTYGWHQEVFYTIPKARYIQTWAPLIFNSTKDNGSIEVAVGSHKERIANQKWNEIPGRATQILVDEAIVEKYNKIVVEMSPGEMLFFSGYLFHRSGSNVSDGVRYSLVGMYHDVSEKHFYAPKLNFNYRRSSPLEFYNEVFDT